MKLKKPLFWDYKKLSFFSFLLLPFTIFIYLKNFFYISNKKTNKKIKTICVGNIYLGGTGKTPFTIKLNEILEKLNFKTAIIKKYYKDQKDEQKILGASGRLYLDNKRINALKKATRDKNEVAIFDDGLQQRSLYYDLTFVCFNAQKWIGNGFLLPAGPLRESLTSLKNYKATIITGNYENNLHIKKQIKKCNPKIKIFEANYVPINLNRLKKNKKFLIFSGIGNPDTFKKTLLLNKIKIAKSLVFPDHFQYNNDDIKKIKKIAYKLKLKILTTEKDYMRLSKTNKKGISFIKVKLTIKNEKELIKFLRINL